MFLVDTNVVSELRSEHKTDRHVLAWAEAAPVDELFLSAVTVMEVELGAWLIARRDAARASELRAWIDGYLLPRFEGRILAFDATVARRCAALHVPNRRPERDAMIAATAIVHKMTVVTRNTRDFESTGVAVLNPWTWSTEGAGP
jgi:predicted nucleic acid-binding protein